MLLLMMFCEALSKAEIFVCFTIDYCKTITEL